MLITPDIRLAVRADARAISELSRDVIEHGLGWKYNRSAVLRLIAHPEVNVAVARDGRRLLGFGIMEYGDSAAHLVLLGVRPDQQGRGLGTQLVRWLETCAVTAGIRVVRVEARADNLRGIAFYQRLGYRERARFPGYYGGRLDGVRLETSLRGRRR